MVDDPRVELSRLLVADADAVGDAGPEVVQHDVGPREQPVDDLLALVRLQVDGEALLPARRLEVQHPAGHVAAVVALRRLDLDHARSEVGEQARAERRRVVRREVHHRHAVERRRRRRPRGRDLAGRPRMVGQRAARIERGRGARLDRGQLRHAHERADLLLAVDLDHVAVVPHLRVLEGLLDAVERLDRDVALLVEDRLPLGPRPGADALEHGLPDALAVGRVLERRQVDVARIRVEVRQPEGVHLRHEEVRHGVRELQPHAVLRDGGQVVRARHLMLQRAPRLQPIGGELVVGGRLQREPAKHVVGRVALQHRGLHARTAVGPAAHVQRGEDALQRCVQRAVAGARHRREAGALAVGDAAELAHAAGLRVDDALVALEVRERAARAEAGHGAVDEPRIALAQCLVTEAQPIHHARAEALDEHVGAGDQLTHALEARLGLEVDLDAALAAVPQPPRRFVPERIAARLLDLDDLGPVVGEDHRGEVAVHPAREVHDSQSVARCCHCVLRFDLSGPRAGYAATDARPARACSVGAQRGVRSARARSVVCGGSRSRKSSRDDERSVDRLIRPLDAHPLASCVCGAA